MSLLEESLRVQQQRLTTQDEQIKMQQKQLEQYELNLQMVADQVRAQGTLLQAQANLFKLDREDREKKEKRERAKARPPASRGDARPPTPMHEAAEVPEPAPVAHHDSDASAPLTSSGVAAGHAEPHTGVDAPPSSEPGSQAEQTGIARPYRSPSPTDLSFASSASSTRTRSTGSSAWTVLPSTYLETVLSAHPEIRCVAHPGLPPAAFLPHPPARVHPEITFFSPEFKDLRGWPQVAAPPMERVNPYAPTATNVDLLVASLKRKAVEVEGGAATVGLRVPRKE